MNELSKQYIKQIYWITILSFVTPFVFLITYALVLKWLSYEAFLVLLQQPLLAVDFVLLVVILPIVLKKQLEKIFLVKHTDDQIRQKNYWFRWVYLGLFMVLGLVPYVFLQDVYETLYEIHVTIIFCVLFNVTAPMTFLNLIYQKLDLLFSTVGIKKEKYFISISSKIRITNGLTTFGSISFLLVGVYMLLYRNMNVDATLVMSMNEIIYRLIIIGFMTSIFIIAPMFVLGQDLTKKIEEIEAYAYKISVGDLRYQLKRTSSDELGLMVNAVNEMRNNLQAIMKGIQDSSKQISTVGNFLGNSSQNLARESQTQVVHTSDMSNSIEQMTMNIEGNSSSAEQCDQLSSEVGILATDTYQVVMENVKAIEEISLKVKGINEIANQTNLLAINATIEAASAGVHGAGFAVVAKEVRVLAEKSRTSAKDINNLSVLCFDLVQKTQKAIDSLKPKAQTTSELSEQISKVSQITRNEGLVISDKIHNLNTMAQSNAEISTNLSNQSKDLAKQVTILNHLIKDIKI